MRVLFSHFTLKKPMKKRAENILIHSLLLHNSFVITKMTYKIVPLKVYSLLIKHNSRNIINLSFSHTKTLFIS